MHKIIKFEVKKGELVPLNIHNFNLMKNFLAKCNEGDQVSMYISKEEKDDGTLSQLAKIHADIRHISSVSGHTFEEIKLLVKTEAGLVIETESSLEVKSFAECSKEELGLVIQILTKIIDLL